MRKQRKFVVYLSWCYSLDPELAHEKCFIYPAKRKDRKYDGYNYVGSSGNDGMNFFICDSLQEAIREAGFNPFAIDFSGLRKREIKEKDEFLSRCTWTPRIGLVVKE